MASRRPTKRGQAASEHQHRHPEIPHGAVHQGICALDGGLEGERLAAGGTHGPPAALDEGEPQDVVGHISKPERA